MQTILALRKQNFIDMAKLIDNDFVGNDHIDVTHALSDTYVTGFTSKAKACICAAVVFKFNYLENTFEVLTQNEDLDIKGKWRKVYPQTIERIYEYLQSNKFKHSNS